MRQKVLILGGSGMLGHKLLQVLSEKFEVKATVRQLNDRLLRLFDSSDFITGVSGENFDSVINAFREFRPEVVINCVGLVKQLPEAKDPIKSLEINSLFPHRVARLAEACGARFIHVSTDCVFDGTKGDYRETDETSAKDLYGKSKALGEVTDGAALTLRTSIIGHQLFGDYGLVQWFLGQAGEKVPAYTKAVFSGLPTVCLSRVIADVISNHPTLRGLYHVASDPISKADLLSLIDNKYSLDAQLMPNDGVVVDRSLNSSQFRQATGMKIPSWTDMIGQMYEDGERYGQGRQRNLIKH